MGDDPNIREAIGKAVRAAWVQRYRQKHKDDTSMDVSKLIAWEDMTEYDRETNRLIGEAVLKAYCEARMPRSG